MGTRSNIGMVHEDGSVTMNYCHWDGYPSHNGKILLENYTTTEKVRKLLALGDLSILGESTETCIAYHRDRVRNFVPTWLLVAWMKPQPTWKSICTCS